MRKYIHDRLKELSSKFGALLAAVGGAGVIANTLGVPWNYVVFAAAMLLVLFPEPAKAPAA
jgi:hypothetical protein